MENMLRPQPPCVQRHLPILSQCGAWAHNSEIKSHARVLCSSDWAYWKPWHTLAPPQFYIQFKGLVFCWNMLSPRSIQCGNPLQHKWESEVTLLRLSISTVAADTEAEEHRPSSLNPKQNKMVHGIITELSPTFLLSFYSFYLIPPWIFHVLFIFASKPAPVLLRDFQH